MLPQPTDIELNIVAERIAPKRAEIRTKQIKELYVNGLKCIDGVAEGRSTDEGYRQTRYSPSIKGGQRQVNGEVLEISYQAYQCGLDVEDDGWGDIPLTVAVRIRHSETFVSEMFPLAQLTADKIQWGETQSDGDTLWKEVDVDSNEARIIRDIVDAIIENHS